ncbi:hypothetical protein J6590_033240 [Homalodisca vitripennis]|nr:hypothetical protein J6590_033240 [Homalodisca vitripennis]
MRPPLCQVPTQYLHPISRRRATTWEPPSHQSSGFKAETYTIKEQLNVALQGPGAAPCGRPLFTRLLSYRRLANLAARLFWETFTDCLTDRSSGQCMTARHSSLATDRQVNQLSWCTYARVSRRAIGKCLQASPRRVVRRKRSIESRISCGTRDRWDFRRS